MDFPLRNRIWQLTETESSGTENEPGEDESWLFDALPVCLMQRCTFVCDGDVIVFVLSS